MTMAAMIQQTAERNAATMTAQGYTFTPAKTEGFFWVVKPNRKVKYLVVAATGRCDCPFGKEHGACKHAVWLNEQLDWEASVLAREGEYTRPVDALN